MKINVNVYRDDKNRYIAYDPDEGGMITVTGRKIEEDIYISIEDNGMGMRKEVLENINLPELKAISIDIYLKERQSIPEQLINFEEFNIKYE